MQAGQRPFDGDNTNADQCEYPDQKSNVNPNSRRNLRNTPEGFRSLASRMGGAGML